MTMTLEQLLQFLDAQGTLVQLMSQRDGRWLCHVDVMTGRGLNPTEAVLSAMYRLAQARGSTHLPKVCDFCSMAGSMPRVLKDGERICSDCEANRPPEAES